MSTESEVYLGLIREKLQRLEDVDRLQTSNSVFANDPRTAVVAKEKQINYINEELARLAAAEEAVESKTVPKAARAPARRSRRSGRNPIIWQGNKSEFASAIIGLFDEKKIRAGSRTDALKKAALHFVDKDGKAFKPKNLWQNFRNKNPETGR